MYKVCDVVFVSIERYEQILSQQFKEPFSFLAFYRLDGAGKHLLTLGINRVNSMNDIGTEFDGSNNRIIVSGQIKNILKIFFSSLH